MTAADAEDDSVPLEDDSVPVDEDCALDSEPLDEACVPREGDFVPLEEDFAALACLRRSVAVVAVLDVAVPRLERAGSCPEAS